MRLIEQISLHAVQNPDHIAIEAEGKKVTYKELLFDAIDGYAENLIFSKCERLAISGDNSLDWILWDLAALHLNIPVIPLPGFFNEEQKAFVIQAAGVTHIAEGSELVETGISALPPLPYRTAKITFTSGSTGTPKGVCLPQSGLESVAESIGNRLGKEFAGRHMCVLPLAILLENVAGVYAALMMGGTVVIPTSIELGMGNPFKPDFAMMLKTIHATKATSIILVPELLRGLLGAISAGAARPDNLKFAAVGGAKVAPELLALAQNMGLPVYEGYGLSECGSVVSMSMPGDERSGTSGRLLPHIKAHTENGEIIIENPAFLGYLGDPKSYHSFRTGDLGSMDADGFVSLQGRKKNLIITSFGRNISPEWVESILLSQPEILQAVVYGDGEAELRALIVPMKENADIDKAITRVNLALPAYARIGAFELTAPFTTVNGMLTGNGRIKRDIILKNHRKDKTMSFYEKLQQQTAAARNELYGVPQLLDGLNGDISRETYIAYLTEAYHHVSHTVRFMMAMGVRLPDSKKWLHDAIAEYIEEEKGHEEWILNDIAAAGGDKEAARKSAPRLETQVLVAYNYDYIARKNPVGFLGMVFMLESTSTQIANKGADAIMSKLGLPKNAFSYLYSHGALDIEHLSFYEKLVNQITDPEDQAAIIEVAQNTFCLFANVLRAIPHQKVQRHAA